MDYAPRSAAGEHELSDHRCLLHDEGTLLAIRTRDLGKNLLQAATRDGIVGGEIRATKERGAIGGEEYRERPPVQAGEALDRALVALRDVRPLVTVHANRNEQRVDERADLGIGVNRAVRFRAPAAALAADVQQHGTVELGGERERLATPRLPVYGLARGAADIARRGASHAIGKPPTLGAARHGCGTEHHEGATIHRARTKHYTL